MSGVQESPVDRLAEAQKWFEREEVRRVPLAKDEVFEIGLSLGGTVSAGAYTAGVLDFLIEALEAWEALKQQEVDKEMPPGKWSVPHHRVQIKVISGTSGGGVCGATLAKALAYDFPHVSNVHDAADHHKSRFRTPDANEDAERNPLYALWVRQLDIAGFCATSDLDDDSRNDKLQSLLNPAPLLKGCEAIAAYPGKERLPLGSTPRPYVSDPLTLLLTLSNITGVPYWTSYGGAGRGQSYRRHADYVRFECHYDVSGDDLFRDSWPDALHVTSTSVDRLTDTQRRRFVGWDCAATFARATGAFPIGFPAVKLKRPAWHYLYQPLYRTERRSLVTSAGAVEFYVATARVVQPAWGDWGQNADGDYNFVAVDGGAFNNQPVELARRHLAGTEGTNERDPDKATRAVVIIDPFSEFVRKGVEDLSSVLASAGALTAAWLTHSRYSTQDFLLATDNEVRSRFLLTAVRDVELGEPLYGDKALACASLGAFGGFLHEAYREHDYFLGRRNCQQFLRKWFVLDPAHRIFGTPVPAAWGNGEGQIPIIPLCGSANEEQMPTPWPDTALDLDFARAAETTTPADLLVSRVQRAGSELLRSFGVSDRLKLVIGFLFWKRLLSGYVVRAVRRSLQSAGLAKPFWRRE